MSGVYVHFPFCESKCHYCDFFSFAESKIPQATRDDSYSSIESEIRQLLGGAEPVTTVFLGGGTPSLVPLDRLSNALSLIPRTSSTEVTMEANPSSISCERARNWRAAGVNRVSMGLQALNDDRLVWLGRVHSVQSVFNALEALFEAGINNVSVDYIVGVPGQTADLIEKEITELTTRFPHIKHISAYLLTLKEQNPKFSQLPDDETQLEHLMVTANLLKRLGFEHYEISNFARPGYRAQHNENYWLGGQYAGVGPSAHSFWPERKMRTKNWSNLHKYSDAIKRGEKPWEWTETLTPEQERIEYLMLRLRRASGFEHAQYEKLFGRSLLSEKKAQIEKAQDEGYLDVDQAHIKLTTRGLFLSDQIVNDLL